ncbi:nitrogenase molybdenum-iron protein alpha chain [Methanomassiliicoccus luminyensis]|uniref:nitrogenase molybdenum-iron protein alpha chain n=1 Tax=Methanomassiliicoccus luminyensis TaxID=1080712 RepID=UPI000369F947|nr:nitrogenase molybdenum-iron protein alpha chain [Methanomassiliicoccus luminyensis]
MTVSEVQLEEMLSSYPDKVKKNRKKHIVVKKGEMEAQQIEANARTIPGILTQRGCCFAGCKGVVLGPIKDMVHIVHGPVGCAYYSWGTRRNKARADESTPRDKIYSTLCFTTDMQESDIVFGGEKKLAAMIDEVVEMFHPRAITISATCPVGLIGDDINAVAKEAQKRHGIQVLAFSCEGYKGVSQSGGHHIANNGLMQHVVGKDPKKKQGKHVINVLGEYNIGGDGWELERILKDVGYTLNSTLSGDSSYEDIKKLHTVDLNLVQCHRSINYIAEMMETKYGIPWLKVNFIGVDATAESLRNMAQVFQDEALVQRTEEVIEREVARITPALEQYRKLCEGKTAFCLVGGSRAHHYQYLLRNLGMDVVVAGYEFAHRDDYEGREVIPSLVPDADGKNIPELHLEPDKELYKEAHVRLNMSKEKYDELCKKVPLSYYEGMYKCMRDGQVLIDDFNHHEVEDLIRILKPDLFFSGVRDKYIVHKLGVPAKQMHSYDYSGPYAGFNGALVFAREVANAMNAPAWKLIGAPWEEGTEAIRSE